MTPFRNEKNSNWEGAYRVPCDGALARQDQGRHRSRTRSSATWTGSRPSWPWPASPTSRRSSRRATRSATRPSRCTSTATTCCPYLTGKEAKSPRQGFIYFTDDGDLAALRYDNWKMRLHGAARRRARCSIWQEPFVPLRMPKIFNLRTDPYERADITSNTYYDWMFDHIYLLVPAQAHRGAVPGDLQGVPAAPEGGELQPRPGDGEDDRRHQEQLIRDLKGKSVR